MSNPTLAPFIKARKEVIVTAGTINSPRLLESSGIGAAGCLQKHGIPVVIDNPNVGENLQNHPMSAVSFEVAEGMETIDPIARQDMSAIGAAMEAYAKQAGPFASGGSFAAAQIPLRHEPESDRRTDLESILKHSVAENDGSIPAFAEAHKEFVHSILQSPAEASGCLISFPGYATANTDGSMAPPPAGTEKYLSIILLLCHPLSRGSVHIDPSAKSGVAIDPKYLSNPLDLEVMARHLLYVENTLIHAEPLKSRLKANGKRNTAALGKLDTVEKAKEYLRSTSVAAHHFTGTCSMMPQELGGVVDSKLRVYGCPNLRVCDASIIPLTPRVNPQATVYAVAEYAADLIRAN